MVFGKRVAFVVLCAIAFNATSLTACSNHPPQASGGGSTSSASATSSATFSGASRGASAGGPTVLNSASTAYTGFSNDVFNVGQPSSGGSDDGSRRVREVR